MKVSTPKLFPRPDKATLRAYLFSIGFISLAGQVALLRELGVAFYGVELIYIVALGVWLSWTAVGSVLGKRGRAPDISTVGWWFVVLGFYFPTGAAAIRAVRLVPGAVAGSYLPLAVQVLSVVLCLAPAGVLLGLLFQWAARHYIGLGIDADSQKSFASAYAIESAGSAAGGLASTVLAMCGVANFAQAVLCAASTVATALIVGSRRQVFERQCAGPASEQNQGKREKGKGASGVGSCFGHASAERGREASWYAFQREALERGGVGAAEIKAKPGASGRFRFRNACLAVLLGATMVALWFSPSLDLQMTRWGHPDLIASLDTPYGRVSVSERGGQYAVFENDAIAFETEGLSSEEFVHLAALHAKKTDQILIAGGGIEGLVREALKYSPSRIDYVEIDERLLSLLRSRLPERFVGFLNAPSVKVRISDPRKFLERTPEMYDLILVGMPEPSSGQANRFYTREYFALCEQKLSDGGILALRLPSAENLWTPFMTYRNAGVYKAMKLCFQDVVALPGTTSTLIASKGKLVRDPEILKKRFESKGIEAKMLTPAYIGYLHENDRFFEIQGKLSGSGAVPNADTRPACYRYTTMIWISKFAPRLMHREVSATGPGRLFLWTVIVLFPFCVVSYRFMGKGKSMRRGVLLVFCAAFVGMVMETQLLLYYQVKQGVLFQNIGVLLMVFMAGMTAGALALARRGQRARRAFRGGKLARWLFAGFVGSNAVFLLLIFCEIAAGIVVVSALLFAAGFLVSAVLAYESLFVDSDQQKVLSPLYASDLAGGCAGSLAASLFFIPFLGMEFTALSMMFLATAAILWTSCAKID